MESSSISSVSEERKIPDSPISLGLNRFRSWRPFQRETINFALNSKKKVVMIDAPTGSGKSILGMAIARFYPSSIYTCTTKDLQDQLVNDFPDIPVLKGRSNYPCKSPDVEKGTTAEDCPLKHLKEKDRIEKSSCIAKCLYLAPKRKAVKAQTCILNVSYFLSEANFVGEFSKKSLVVIDEADRLESELMRFIEVTISQRTLDYLQVGLPKYKTKFESWKEWAMECLPVIDARIKFLERSFEDFLKGSKPQFRLYSLLTGLRWKMELFVKKVDKNWVFIDRGASWIFKPVWIREFCKDYLFRHAQKFIFMSATILSPSNLAYVLGLNREDWDYISIPSQFDVDTRKVYYLPTANIIRKSREEEMPKLIPVIGKILKERPDKKGLIHTVSYQNARYLMDHLKDSRLIIHDSNDRSSMLQRFIRSDYPLVIISPSMDRGIDFKYDLCSFIIIIKLPYADLSDKQISTRVYSSRYGQEWYAWITACTIVQMSGRATRAYDDFSETFILDEQFAKFYKNYHKLFPNWWKEALTIKDMDQD